MRTVEARGVRVILNRFLAVGLLLAALSMVLVSTAVADQHPAAADGQRLEDQSADVQALYRSVHGANAEAQWIADHNAAIGATMMADDMMADAMDPTASMYYGRIVAVATARGADADLASRIAADVIGRGTEAAFLAGTDAGVLYGIGTSEDDINNPPASAPAPAAAPAPAPSSGWGGTIDMALIKDQDAKITLPSVAREATQNVAYKCTPDVATTIPNLALDAYRGEIKGEPTEIIGTKTFTCNVQVDGEYVDDSDGVPLVVTVNLKVVEPSRVPVFASTQKDLKAYQGVVFAAEDLPIAYFGSEDIEYSLDPIDPLGFSFIGGTVTDGVITASTLSYPGASGPPVAGNVQVTYTAKDKDGDKATLTFMLTVEADEDVEFAAGDTWERSYRENQIVTLPALSKDGNGGITYSVEGQSTGTGLTTDDLLSKGRQYQVDLGHAADRVITFTYKATENQVKADTSGSTDSITVTINIVPSG